MLKKLVNIPLVFLILLLGLQIFTLIKLCLNPDFTPQVQLSNRLSPPLGFSHTVPIVEGQSAQTLVMKLALIS